ncbi:MAG TPA: hypothetical protein VIM75_17225 [Ohtaekwangia sp.]|uniref:hypothetical protein n=1 Tax=Ohtaekwangia sp. TaxID=2066019 RepID=UPI002F941461
MENQKVTLTITADNGYPQAYTSDIRVFNGSKEQFRQIKQVEYSRVSELYLGTLNELKDSYLIVDTFARRVGEDDFSNKTARVSYEIKYGQQTVEMTTIESHFIDRTLAFLGFRFRFCPRHPFC